MKNNLTTVEEVQVFMEERLARAGHHAKNVIDVVPALIGFAMSYGKSLTVKFEEDTPIGNLLWFTLNSTPYCLAYNHNTLKVELRDRNQRGKPIEVFDNSSNLNEISNLFKILSFQLQNQTV